VKPRREELARGQVYLAEHERVEEESVPHGLVVVLKNVLAEVQNAEEDDKLVGALADDVPPHGGGDEGIVASRGRTVEESRGRRFSAEGKSSHGVHDKVHPEELNSLQGSAL
jgi:hypothetical protein